ncbi:MAG: cysteine desulfurase [Pirellulaceae bacterium]|nr:MAG: cysteine desulfurase [Pirellulaceae bacterium]
MKQIYLDYNATTPVAPSVREAMGPFLAEFFGNPSSSHAMGRACREAIEDARSQVARLIGADSDEIVFTSGGTESNNLALCGVMLRDGPPWRGHLVISAFEHPSVAEPARFLRRLGCAVTVVPCTRGGLVDVEAIQSALRPETRLVSIMHANNEIGTVQPVRQVADMCRPRGILVHTDASQSIGKIPCSVDELGVDLLTIAGHKVYAPKGIGALYVRRGTALDPYLHGAGHEGGLRPGTENTAYIVGLGRAARLAGEQLDQQQLRMTQLRDRLAQQLQAGIDRPLLIHGETSPRLPNTLSVAFPGVTAAEMLRRVPELCASTGSACHSGSVSMSPTLAAIGVAAEVARGTMRLSVGWYTSQQEVDRAADILIHAWESLATS